MFNKYFYGLATKYGLSGITILSFIYYLMKADTLNPMHIVAFAVSLLVTLIISFLSNLKSIKTEIFLLKDSILSLLSELSDGNYMLTKSILNVHNQISGKLVDDSLRYHIPHFLSSIKLELFKMILSDFKIARPNQFIDGHAYTLAQRTDSTLTQAEISHILKSTINKVIKDIEKYKNTDPMVVLEMLDNNFEAAEHMLLEAAGL